MPVALVTGSGTNNGSITIGTGGTLVVMGGLIGNPPSSSTIDPGAELIGSFVRQQTVSIGGTVGTPQRDRLNEQRVHRLIVAGPSQPQVVSD